MAVRRCQEKLPGGGTCGRPLPEPGPGGGRPRTKCEVCSPSRPRKSSGSARGEPEQPAVVQVLLPNDAGPGRFGPEPVDGTVVPESVYAATLGQLAAAERAHTAAGATALALALALDARPVNPGPVANALLKAMDVALAGAKPAADALDELRKRRERKASGA